MESYMPRTKSQGVGIGERYLKKPDEENRMHYGFKPKYVNTKKYGMNIISNFNPSMSKSYASF